MHDAREAIDFNSLHQRLAPAEQDRLASIVLDAANADTTLEDGLACIDAFRREERESIRGELKARIRLAEREGRIPEAIELMGQLEHL